MTQPHKTNAGDYNLENFAQDLQIVGQLAGGQRGAAVTAAKKRFKMAIVLRWLHKIADEYKLDMTPILAGHIVSGWLDRGISKSVLNDQFGIPSRTASQKSADFDRIEEMVTKYRPHVLEDITVQFQAVHLLSKGK